MISIGQLVFAHNDEHSHLLQQQPVIYTCVMHPQIQKTGPGKCPICGMALVKQKTKSTTAPKLNPAKKPPVKNSPAPVSSSDKKPVIKQMEMPGITIEKPSGLIPKPPATNEETKNDIAEKAGHKIEDPGPTYKPKMVRYDLYQ